MRVHTGQQLDGGLIVPNPDGDVLCFPYAEDGRIVNVKYRHPGKRFTSVKGAPLVFYGLDEARAAHAARPSDPLIITEGEIDFLSALDAGSIALSVPNGAPPGEGPINYEPPTDGEDHGFDYLRKALDFVLSFRDIVIATDGDGPGTRLREELARRIGRAASRFVNYPEGSKDLNEVLQKIGIEEVQARIANAEQFPLRGLHKFSEYRNQEPIIGYRTGIDKLDPYYRPHPGSLTMLTGIPNHGKSTLAIDLAASMSKRYGWPVAITSFEMQARRVHDCLVDAYGNQPLQRAGIVEREKAEAWAERDTVLIDAGDWDVKVTVEWACQRLIESVQRYGTRIVIIDPWGEFDHPRNNGQITTDYIGDAVKKLRKVSIDLDLVTILVVHPHKMMKNPDGNFVIPSMYDAHGSAHFANKIDFSLTVHRSLELHEAARVLVEKVRYQPETGTPGDVVLNFNPATGKYY